MIIDSRSLPINSTIECDVCIVGAGLAGISIAREFIGSDTRVCLLEGGGLQPDKTTQSLYWGENTGHQYYALDTARARLFGGSSHRWRIGLGDNRLGVRLRPLDKLDFEERETIPYSGWPFGKEHLNPFYERAQKVFRIGPFRYGANDWEDPMRTPRLPFEGGMIKTVMFQFGRRELFFGEYKEEIARSENIMAFLYGNAVDIETRGGEQRVSRLLVACLNGDRIGISAKEYVLAMGGIENPRLLLLSNRVQSNGLGNQNDLVGRFFMEHVHISSGLYIPETTDIFDSAALYAIHDAGGIPVMGKLALSEEVVRREGIPNYCVSLHPIFCQAPNDRAFGSKGVESLKSVRAAVAGGRIPNALGNHVKNILADCGGIAKYAYERVGHTGRIKAFRLDHMSEQVPNPESRVTLSDELDALGCRRIRLHWQLSPLDIKGIVRAQEIIDAELRRTKLGRLQIELQSDAQSDKVHGGWHHMGTTRMHTDPKLGVVDENCKVHGIQNLFVAGSSVFPTCGYANPNLTIAALALRLSDHLKTLMR